MRVPKPVGFAIGEANSMYGKHHKKTSRRLMSERATNRKIGKCVHCGKEMSSSPLTRYHNNNCKLKVDK